MDGTGESGVVAWTIDALAALLFAAAAAFAGTSLLGPPAAAVGGSAGFAVALLFLRSVKPEAARHRLPVFEPAKWDGPGEFEGAVELTEREPLLLDDPLIVEQDSRVVRLFAAHPLPSPGEMKARIDAHLAGKDGPGEVVQLPVDASAALRDALADLRRSLG